MTRQTHGKSREDRAKINNDHAACRYAEIDSSVGIIHLDQKGEALLKLVLIANGINGNNLYPVLEHIAPAYQ